MREIILELAVRGLLLAQKPEEAENGDWTKIRSRFEGCLASNQSNSDIPFMIPAHWCWVTLSDLGDTKPRNGMPDDKACSFVPMAMVPAGYGKSVQHEVRPWGEIKKGYTHFQNGDVVMAKITPCFENGKSVVIDGLEGGAGAGTTELHVFRPEDPNILSEYVTLYIKTPGFIARGVPKMTGSAGQKRVPSDYFSKSLFPLPPLAEQKRIVEKVDELMALCDRLEAQQRERDAKKVALTRAALDRFSEEPSPANLGYLFHPSYDITPADLRKTILTMAVQGKLVPQDLGEEEPSKTFSGLKPRSWADNLKDIPPARWVCCFYRDLTSLITSGSRGWKEFYSLSGAIFIRTQNIKTDRLILDDVAYVDLPKSTEGKRSSVYVDDILITITGANVTKAARIESPIPESYVSQHIALTRPKWIEMSPWLHLCFLSPASARGRLESLAYGDKPGLNLENIRSLPFPIPPLNEQKRILAKVKSLMDWVDQLETEQTTASATAEKLLEAVVAEMAGSEMAP
jgi:type I restriction enzyme S subunit